jgi:chromosome segregation ATPase
MRRALTVATILMLVSGPLFAEIRTQNLPSVDVVEANEQIAELETENSEMEDENAQLLLDIDELETSIAEWNQQIIDIDPILTQVSVQLEDLLTLNRTIVDAELKAQAQEAIGRARLIKRSLEATTQQLQRNITEARALAEANRNRIRLNNGRIKENNDEIVYLRAAIEKTEQERSTLSSFITVVDSILTEAEQFMGEEEQAEGTDSE